MIDLAAANFDIIDCVTVALGLFFVVANLSYGILLLFSAVQIITLRRSKPEIQRKMAVFRSRASEVPKISIVIPAYNEAVVIAQSVRSFLDLDYGELEVIVVNDGSTDHTL
jgi:cellulose synthase/poly-beta-1,6-N-acetylglucosamine synthase-like glycosyltransferase